MASTISSDWRYRRKTSIKTHRIFRFRFGRVLRGVPGLLSRHYGASRGTVLCRSTDLRYDGVSRPRKLGFATRGGVSDFRFDETTGRPIGRVKRKTVSWRDAENRRRRTGVGPRAFVVAASRDRPRFCLFPPSSPRPPDKSQRSDDVQTSIRRRSRPYRTLPDEIVCVDTRIRREDGKTRVRALVYVWRDATETTRRPAAVWPCTRGRGGGVFFIRARTVDGRTWFSPRLEMDSLVFAENKNDIRRERRKRFGNH